ncbi:hypothetical protein C8R46DRAFT_582741 [Mycena filopes]|nr:hypothetical protein C8R46DRAFT_124498 [Mycena filopes]KAJ7180429.1 hypothetical protein C8R46DRAFT_582741 [Mycena filopes]
MSDEQFCLHCCLHCTNVVVDDRQAYCSYTCRQLASAPSYIDDKEDDAPTYSSWHRISLWAQAVDPTPPPSPPLYLSPSKRILTPQFPTACIITSDSDVTSKPHASPPRPTRTSPTATESLVASSTTASPISLGGLVRSWAPKASRPQLPRLTTANFTVFAKTHPPPPPRLLPSDESTSDGDISPVWWVSQDPATTSSSPESQRFVIQRRAPAPRGRKLARAAA